MANQQSSSARKPRLGRGLSSLIVNSSQLADVDETYVPVAAPTSQIEPPPAQDQDALGSKEIDVGAIAPNPYQPRRAFGQEELAELTESVRRQGILQPLIVTRAPDGSGEREYVLIAGERRLRAARDAGLDRVPCVVREASRQQMLEWALVENIHREDLNPVERARAYREYMDRFELSQADAAERLGQARPTVANYVRLLELCDEVQGLLTDGTLSFGHGKVLGALVGDQGHQIEIGRKIVAKGLSVRETERMVAAAREVATRDPGSERRAVRPKAAYVVDLEERLTGCVGTRVRILPGRTKNSGRIVVDYYTLDDFDRIAGNLGLTDEG